MGASFLPQTLGVGRIVFASSWAVAQLPLIRASWGDIGNPSIRKWEKIPKMVNSMFNPVLTELPNRYTR